MKLIDKTLGLNDISWKVFQRLARVDIKEVNNNDQIDFKTSTWYNGRERGFCLTIRKWSVNEDGLIICWAEQRNSDEIVVYNTEYPYTINPFNLADLNKKDKTSENFWNSRRCFRESEVNKAALYIVKTVKEWVKIHLVERVMET